MNKRMIVFCMNACVDALRMHKFFWLTGMMDDEKFELENWKPQRNEIEIGSIEIIFCCCC